MAVVRPKLIQGKPDMTRNLIIAGALSKYDLSHVNPAVLRQALEAELEHLIDAASAQTLGGLIAYRLIQARADAKLMMGHQKCSRRALMESFAQRCQAAGLQPPHSCAGSHLKRIENGDQQLSLALALSICADINLSPYHLVPKDFIGPVGPGTA